MLKCKECSHKNDCIDCANFENVENCTRYEYERRMPDHIKDDWSNLPDVVEQFRMLGVSDSYILDTLVSVSKVMSENWLEDFE